MGMGRVVAAAAGSVMLIACGANVVSKSLPGDDSFESAPRRNGSGVVIEGPALGGTDRTVLNVLRQRVAGLRIDFGGGCPELIMRGRNSIHSSPNPTIYVNDARATNTCVLDDMRMSDIGRIEVYPAGIGPSPSYGASPNGLILVFTRRDEL